MMTQEAYMKCQRDNIEKALKSGRALLRTSRALHKLCDEADAGSSAAKKNYLLDAFQYYDFNTAATELSGMPVTLGEFKRDLIDIKIENDKMLLDGGYRKDVDEMIASVFLSHTLCKIQIIDAAVLGAVQDALDMLETMKTMFS